MGANVCIRIEVLNNGYEVEIPDVDAMNKADAAAKKKGGGMGSPAVWPGDYTKSYVAKTADDVLAIIKPALKNLPQTSYDEAFAEASAEDD